MHIEHSHTLPHDDAKARMKVFAEYLTNKAGVSFVWDPAGERAHVSGKYLVVTIDAQVEIGANRVVFDGKDPGMLWRGKAKEFIERKLKAYMDPTTPIEQLPRR